MRDTLTPTVAPHDSSMDITDCWMERHDPQNERGEFVMAYFDHAVGLAYDAAGNEFKETVPTLHQISVEGTNRFDVYDRDAARLLLGIDTVDRLEEIHGETL